MIGIILKSIAVYFVVLLVMKLMGKREIGQLSLFDFVVVLIIADIAVIGIDKDYNEFYYYLLPILLLAIIQKILAYILLKVPFLRSFFDGTESIIMHDGILDIKEMRKQAYNVDDLIVQLRLKNIASLSLVKDIILEANGEMSVFLDNDDNKVKTDTKSKPNNIIKSNSSSKVIDNDNKYIPPFPLIVSGKVIKKNIEILGIDEKWIYKEINKQGYDDVKEIYFASLENGKVFIVKVKD